MNATANNMQTIVIGQRVKCALHYCGHGIVFGIHGTQQPQTVRTVLDGVGQAGGNARFDIVFENGSKAIGTPECIVRGVQWQIFDQVATADELAQALAHAAIVQAAKSAQKEQAQAAFAAEVEALKAAPQYAHLTQASDKLDRCKLATLNIRADLKKHFPGVKFSVRKPEYSSVYIGWSDGPTPAAVEEVTRRYKAGKFDSQEDMYVSEKRPFSTVFGDVDYISTLRDESAELIEKAIAAVYEKYSSNLAEIPRPTAEEFRAGRLFYVNVSGLDSLERLIRVQVNNLPG